MKNGFRSNVRGWLVAAALCGLSLSSQAAKSFPDFMATVRGNATTVAVGSNGTILAAKAPGQLVPGGGWTTANGATYGAAAGAAGAVRVGTDAVVAVGGKSVGVQASGSISKADIVGAVVGCLGSTLVGCAVGGGLAIATAYLATSGLRSAAPGAAQPFEQRDPTKCYTAPCYSYRGQGKASNDWFPTLDQAVAASVGKPAGCSGASIYYKSVISITPPVNARFQYAYCGSDALVGSGSDATFSRVTVSPASPTWDPITPQAVRDALIADSANNPPVTIVRELENAGVDWTGKMVSPTVTGPSQVKGPVEITTNPDGSTKTTQKVTQLTYTGPTVSEGPTTTTSIDRNSSGVTTGTTTTTSTPASPDESEQPAPEKEQPTQCDKYPDTLGCAELDTPELEIPKEERVITYTAETPFGGGSCPADKSFASTLAGRSFKAVDWVQWCSYAPMIRTLVILLATISAFFIVSLGKDAE